MLVKFSFGTRQAFLFSITSLIVAFFHDFLRGLDPWQSIGEFVESWFSHSVAILLLTFIVLCFFAPVSKFFLGEDASEIKPEKVFVYVLLFLLSGIIVLFLAWALVWRNI